jgi:hypothetical protein
METVKSIRVVLVSPADVPKEREAVQTAIQQVNHVASRRGVTFDLRRWEDVSPGYHPDGAQALVASGLDIEQCDLLIGVFWKRFGVIDQAPYSRTAWEILGALKARGANSSKPDIKVYFCKTPWSPASVEESDQQTRVLEFKEKLVSEGTVLYKDYVDVQDFSAQVLTNLFGHLIESLPEATAAQASTDVQLSAHVTSIPIPLRSESMAELMGDLRITIYGIVPSSWVGDEIRLDVSVFPRTSVENQAAEDGLCDVILASDSVDGPTLSRGRLLVRTETGTGIGVSFDDVRLRIKDSKLQQDLWIRGIRGSIFHYITGSVGASVAVTIGNDHGYASTLPPQDASLGVSVRAGYFSARRTSSNLDSIIWPGEAEGPSRTFSIFTVHFRESFYGAFRTHAEEAGRSPGTADCGTVFLVHFMDIPEPFDLYVTAHDLRVASPYKPLDISRALATHSDALGRPLNKISAFSPPMWNRRVWQLPSFQIPASYTDIQTPMVSITHLSDQFEATWEFVSRAEVPFGGLELVFGVALVGPGDIQPPTRITLCGNLAPMGFLANQHRGIPRFLPVGVPEWLDLE